MLSGVVQFTLFIGRKAKCLRNVKYTIICKHWNSGLFKIFCETLETSEHLYLIILYSLIPLSFGNAVKRF